MKKVIVFSLGAVGLVVLLLVVGCLPGAQFGAPGVTGIRGKVAMPGNNCYTLSCASPQVSEGNVPAPQAKVRLEGEGGQVLETQTDDCGNYEVSGASDSCYVLYADVPGGTARVKKGIILESGKTNDAGEANYYTTAQVIVYEVAKQLYPGLVKCSDIPNFDLTRYPEFVEAVKRVLARCEDAQKDGFVLQWARRIAAAYFGAPGGGGAVVGGGGAPAGGGGGGTAPATTTTITASKTATFTPNSVSGTITVNNTGTVATTGLTIVDQLQKWDGTMWVDVDSITISVTSQIPAGGSATFDYSFTNLTFEPGVKYRNKAVVSITNGNSVTVYAPEEGAVPVEPQPAIKIEKTGPDFVPAGETAEYHITVTNTGNVPLTNVRVDDNCGGVSKEYTYTGTLAPGGVWGFDVECTPTWEGPAQVVTNTATASGKYGDTTVSDTDSANLYAFILRKQVQCGDNAAAQATVRDVPACDPPSTSTEFSFTVKKGNTQVGTFTITGAGEAKFFLGEGTYTIIEDPVPEGWSTQYSDGSITVTTGSGNWYGDWTITNTYTGGSGGGGGTVCVPATITDFNVTASCSCPEALSTDFQSTCSTCKKPPAPTPTPTPPCKTCTIEITNVQASGSPTLEYRYSYRKKISQTSWTDWTSSDWTTAASYQFVDIEECESRTYEVRVEVQNTCTTLPATLTEQITLGGECCCYFKLINTDQHPIRAVWHKEGGKWKVLLDGWVDDNVCNDSIEVKAELYLGNENQHKTDKKTASGRNFAIEALKIDSGIESDNPPSGNYKVKITLKNLDDSSCQEKVYWVDVTSS